MKTFWFNRSGSGYPLAISLVLATLLISCCLFEYFRLTIIAAEVRDATQRSIIAIATENYRLVYSGLRQSYSGGYTRSGHQWIETWTTGDIYKQMSDELRLTQTDQGYARISNGETAYYLSHLNVKIMNTPFAPSSSSANQQFTAEAELMLTVPLSFGWGHLPPMKAKLKVKAIYRPRF